MEQIVIKLTKNHDLFHHFFWEEETVIRLSKNEKKEMNETYDPSSFHYEFYHYLGFEKAFKPWESKNSIGIILDQWPSYHQSLTTSFQSRDFKYLLPLMKKGIACCFSILFWMNKRPINLKNWEENTELFSYKPINFIERMNFILSRPTLFHSFVQLSELMEELTKTYQKILILNKRKNV